jgi:hypothetical protein
LIAGDGGASGRHQAIGTKASRCAMHSGIFVVRPKSKKAPESIRNQGLAHLVAWGGIEPPTQGFSILCSTD